MKILISEQLSKNKFKTPEGYLICRDAILARTGKQEYRRREVFGDSGADNDDDIIEVDRKEEEVFSKATLASFENKPVTVEHPSEDVNANNWKDYQVGFVRDVRRGKTEDGEDVIIGNLVIQDAQAIEEIENGEHCELSCGYDCDIQDEEHPQQRNIRGNHVALCEQGRAGCARIVDSKVEDDIHTYYSTIRNQKFKIKGLPNHRIKMIYENGKEEEKKESYFKELLQKQIIRIVDSKVEDTKFVVYNEDNDCFGRFDTKEEAKKQIKELKAFDKRYGNPFDEVYRIEVEDSVEDAVGTSKAYEMYLQRLERFKNDKEALEYDLKDLMRTKALPKDEVEDLISKYKHRISKLQDSINDSKLEKVSPELLLNLNDWFSDKLYIEKKYNVKISNITSNQGLTITGSKENLEKLSKDFGIKQRIVDSKIDDEVQDMSSDPVVVEFKGDRHLVEKLKTLADLYPRKKIRSILSQEVNFNPKMSDKQIEEVARELGIKLKDSIEDEATIYDSVAIISSNSFGSATMYGPTSIEDIERLANAKEKIYFEQTYGGKTHGFWKAASTILKELKTGQMKITKIYDSVKDANSSMIEFLIKDEEEAIKGYERAIEQAKQENNEVAIARFQEIINDEMEHIQELKDLLSNDIHDSVKDSIESNNHIEKVIKIIKKIKNK